MVKPLNDELLMRPTNLTSMPFLFTLYILLRMQKDQLAISSPVDRLHPKQNVQSELKRRTCFGMVPSKFSCSSVKGLRVYNVYLVSNYEQQVKITSFTDLTLCANQNIYPTRSL